MNETKTVLIVDDSEIDRTILTAILSESFAVEEKCGGYTAIEYIVDNTDKVDALLLDISMPGMTGFDVLDFLQESEINDFPVLLITAEATRENVEKAKQYNVSGFIRKPFDREDVMQRLYQQLGVLPQYHLTEKDMEETKRYIANLESIYKRYLINFGDDYEHYIRLTEVMGILLDQYEELEDSMPLDSDQKKIICRAAFFCDIGNMVVPPKNVRLLRVSDEERDNYPAHTVFGAELVGLNRSDKCRYFVNMCTEFCLHHHERYDGKGFPHKVVKDHNLEFTQILRLAERFDRLFYKYVERNEKQFEFTIEDLEKDEGFVSEKILSLVKKSKKKIMKYYEPIQE